MPHFAVVVIGYEHFCFSGLWLYFIHEGFTFPFEVSVAFVLLLVLLLIDKKITFLGLFLCGFYCLFIQTLKEIFICLFIVLFLVALLSAWFSACCICVWCYAVGVLL